MSTTARPAPARSMPLPSPSDLAHHWTHDPGIVFLNHGSFGATPRAVQQSQTRYREQLEREPVDFFVNTHWDLMDRMRASLSAFVHAPASDLVPVPNATIGVATVLKALKLSPGDEILTNNHEYPACQNNLRAVAARTGAQVVVADIPFPIAGPQAVIDAILSKVTSKTRVVLLSHVTSPTGLVMPVEPIVAELNRRRILSLIDGAHAPGMVPTLNIAALQPTFYTANCHKWICSPKGSAFLYVSPEHQPTTRPVILSNNAEKPRPNRSQFHTEFDYIGTADSTSLYSIPDAIQTMSSLLPDGFQDVMRHNHALMLKGREVLCNALNIEPPAPQSMLGSICTLILPPHDPARQERLKQRPTRNHDALQDALIERHRTQVPVWGLPNKPDRFLRISAQLYNSLEQYQYLAQALRAELKLESQL